MDALPVDPDWCGTGILPVILWRIRPRLRFETSWPVNNPELMCGDAHVTTCADTKPCCATAIAPAKNRSAVQDQSPGLPSQKARLPGVGICGSPSGFDESRSDSISKPWVESCIHDSTHGRHRTTSEPIGRFDNPTPIPEPDTPWPIRSTPLLIKHGSQFDERYYLD